MSVTCRRASRPAGSRRGSSRRARPTSRSSRPPTAPRSPPPACSPPTWWRRRRCRSAAGTSPTAAPRRWCSTRATPTRRRGSGVGPTRCRMCELTAQALGCATTDVLVCPTGLIGIPMPMDPVESGIPKLGAAADDRRRRRAAAADAHAHHRHRAARRPSSPSSSRRRASPRPSAAWPRVRRCWRRRWRRCSRCSPPTPRSPPGRCSARSRPRSTDSFNALVVDACQSTNDTVLVLANGAAGNEPITTTSGFALRRRSSRRSPPRAPTSPTRWPPTPRARPSCVTLTVRGARNAAEARHGGAHRREQPARAVLALRQGPLLGPGDLRARA